MQIKDLRKRIDIIDTQVVKLINECAEVVIEIGKLKNAAGSQVYAPDREKKVFEKITKANKARFRISA